METKNGRHQRCCRRVTNSVKGFCGTPVRLPKRPNNSVWPFNRNVGKALLGAAMCSAQGNNFVTILYLNWCRKKSRFPGHLDVWDAGVRN